MDRLMDLQLIYRGATLGRLLGKTEEGSPVCLRCVILLYLGRMLVHTNFIRFVEIKDKDREG